jgi:insulysin
MLPVGQSMLEFDVQDSSNMNSALLSYFEFGLERDDMRSKLLTELCWQYLEEPTFDQLRTTEQLGYIVSTVATSTRDVIGLKFIIQSTVKDCLGIKESLDNQLAKMSKNLADLSDDDFDEIKDSVLTLFEEKDVNLKEEFDRYFFKDLITHKYVFNRQQLECELIKTITKAEFIDHFSNMFNPETARRLDICYHSSFHGKAKADCITVTEFKKAIKYFPDTFKENLASKLK